MGRAYDKEWMPVCVASRDELLYYLHTVNNSMVGYGLLDTLRFSDIAPNGKKILSCTDEELVELVEWFCEPVRYFGVEDHIENLADNDKPSFEIRCPTCSFVEIFEELNEIPHENHRCPCCGKYVIEYYGDDIYDDVSNTETIQERMKKAFDYIIEKYAPDRD